MEAGSDDEFWGGGLLSVPTRYLITGTGVIYAAGFLVLLLFLDQFGIRESGTDMWKVKFVHVGILCVMCPIVLCGTCFGFIQLIKSSRLRPVKWIGALPLILANINLSLVCSVFILFARFSPEKGKLLGWYPFLGIVVLTVVANLGSSYIAKLPIKKNRTTNSLNKVERERQNKLEKKCSICVISFRLFMCGLIAWISVKFGREFLHILNSLQVIYGVVYIVTGFLLGFIFMTLFNKFKLHTSGTERAALVVVAMAFVSPLFYLMILTFAQGVFPAIPSTRGGGDYTVAPRDVFEMKADEQKWESAPAIFASQRETRPLIIIEETMFEYFAADPKDAGGPEAWRIPGGQKPVIHVFRKPEVLRVIQYPVERVAEAKQTKEPTSLAKRE